MTRREYTSGRPTTLAAAFDIGAGSFTIADDGSEATWPTSADYNFFVTIDAGTAQEERVLCSARASRVITVAASGRGVDGTTESNHLAGATVWPSWSATDADEANEHINLTTGVHGYTATAAELNILDGATLSTAELNILDGATLSTAELNYVDGVTSAIQTQLNAKAPLASPTFTGTVALPALGSGLVPTGSIVMYGGATAPATGGWLLCDGGSTTGYTALAAIVGANVPDLRGRAPIGYGSGTGLTARTTMGATTGAETHTLTEAQMPSHSHTYQFGNGGALDTSGTYITQVSPNLVTVGSSSGAGSGSAHNIMQPSIVVNFIIKT